MAELNKPTQRTFWVIQSQSGSVVHKGFTDPDQITTTGLIINSSNTDATNIYPALPSIGSLTKGNIYSYNKGMIIVEQTHERTIYPPEQTPALFTIYRANTEQANWIENEKVIAGDKRNYNLKEYKCLQSHTTQVNWTPDLTPNLWEEVMIVPVILVWKQPTGAQDAYKIGDKVHFPLITSPVYQSLINANVWSPVVYPAGWQVI